MAAFEGNVVVVTTRNYLHTYMSLQTHRRSYTHTRARARTHTHTHTHIYTHTHTHTNAWGYLFVNTLKMCAFATFF